MQLKGTWKVVTETFPSADWLVDAAFGDADPVDFFALLDLPLRYLLVFPITCGYDLL